MGNSECSFLKAYLVEKLEYVMMSIIIDRPSIKPFRMGDASSRYINVPCPGHPTHNKLVEIDFDYPTISGKGTQYGQYTDGSHESIWIDNDPKNMILDESKVDWWATWQIIIRLQALYNGKRQHVQYIIHEKIYDLILKNISRDEGQYFYTVVNIDQMRNYNHDTHMHLKLDDEL